MSIAFIQEYLPLYQEAMILTIRIGWSGIVFAVAADFFCALIQYYKNPVLRQIVAVYIRRSCRRTETALKDFFENPKTERAKWM